MTLTPLNGRWYQQSNLTNKRFTCGHCGENVSSDVGYAVQLPNGSHAPCIYICHACNRPTSFTIEQVPSPSLGNPVSRLPSDIDALYTEIRKATSVNAYTAAVMGARKLLMHIAVEKGAAENLRFAEYVTYLRDHHYTPPNSTKWVDSIRTMGNDANHEIVLMSADDASRILIFVEMLMKFIYEFPDAPDEDESA